MILSEDGKLERKGFSSSSQYNFQESEDVQPYIQLTHLFSNKTRNNLFRESEVKCSRVFFFSSLLVCFYPFKSIFSIGANLEHLYGLLFCQLVSLSTNNTSESCFMQSQEMLLPFYYLKVQCFNISLSVAFYFFSLLVFPQCSALCLLFG